MTGRDSSRATSRARRSSGSIPRTRPRSDPDRLVLPQLRADGQVDVFVPVVLVSHVHVVAGPDVVTDLDPLVTDDADALAEHAAVADRDHRIAGHADLRRKSRA